MARTPITQLGGRTPLAEFQSLNPDSNVLGVKSNSVLGEQPKRKPSFKRGIEGVKRGFQVGGGGRALVDPLIGAGKEILSTLSGASELGQRGLRAITPDFGKKPEIAKIPEKFTEATSGFQKAGKFAMQIGEFAAPAGAVSKIGKGRGALKLVKRALTEGLTFGGVSALQEGKIDKEVGSSALIGAAFPVAGAGFKGVKKALSIRAASPKVMAKARGKAEKLATEILQPKKADIKLAKLRGSTTSDSVKEYVKSVEKAKNFDEAAASIKSKVAKDFAIRNNILKKNNFTLKQDRLLKDLRSHITKSENSGLVSSDKLKGMKEVLKSEESWLKRNVVDRVKGQARKELIYKEAKPIYKKQEAGNILGNEEGRVKAFELLGKGYKIAVEAGDDTVRAINASYGAKQGVIEMLAGRAALADKAMTPTTFQKIASPLVDLISQATGAGSASFITKLALKQEKNLFKLTKKLKKLSDTINKGESQKEIARQLEVILGKKVPQLTAGKIGQKPFVKKPTIRLGERVLDETQKGLKPKSGRITPRLPVGSKSGKPISLPRETVSARRANRK